MSHRIFPHGLPRPLAENLWQVEGSLAFPIPRNMTIWRAADGRLVLYSVIAMNEEGMRALEQLGKPAFMVIPHLRHHMDAPFYKHRYPDLRTLAESSTPANGVSIDGSMKELAPLGVVGERLPGTDHEDIVLDLPVAGGRALCICELLTNVSPTGALGRLVGRLIGPPGGHFGISRIVRLREVVDRPRVRAWLTSQAQRSDVRMLLMGHGPPVLQNVSDALTLAASHV